MCHGVFSKLLLATSEETVLFQKYCTRLSNCVVHAAAVCFGGIVDCNVCNVWPYSTFIWNFMPAD